MTFMDYHISKSYSQLKPSAIREILKFSGQKGIISLAAGDPAPESLPVKKLDEITENLLKDEPLKALLYSTTEGYSPLREQIVKLLEEHYKIPTKDNQLIITTGAQQGIFLTAQVLCDPNDVIICENPSFIGALNAFRATGVNLVGVDMEPDGINIEGLETALKANPNTRVIYVIPNFQNPTGSVMSLEKRHEVYNLAQKYNVIILEDNPYGDLCFEGEVPPSIKSFDTDGRVVYVGTFSKILSSGLRVGYALSPNKIAEKTVVAKQCADVHTSMISQLICYNFLTTTSLQKHLDSLKIIYKDKSQLMYEGIKKHFPKEVKCNSVTGGLFLWCTLPEGFNTDNFAKELVKQAGVCIVPGSAFMVDQSKGSNSFRLNFSNPSKEDIATAMEKTGKLLKEFI